MTTTEQATGAQRGFQAAMATLRAAGDRGVPMRLLIALVAHVGQVAETTAYQTLRREMRHSGSVWTSGMPGPGRHGMTLDSQVIHLRAS